MVIYMKHVILIGILAATAVFLGCAKQEPQSVTPSASGSPPVAATDGSNTWFLGTTLLHDTNVSTSNVTVRVRSSEPTK